MRYPWYCVGNVSVSNESYAKQGNLWIVAEFDYSNHRLAQRMNDLSDREQALGALRGAFQSSFATD